MNKNLEIDRFAPPPATHASPILIVPYMWIGDFVRCHSVVAVLHQRFPNRPVDMLATTLCAPLADYMPGVRQTIVADLPRGRLALSQQTALAGRLKREGYGTVLVVPRTWKSALAPFIAGIPQRVGFAGEARFILINDLRFGERKLPRMVDRCAMLALPRGAKQPSAWPMPELKVPAAEIAAWRDRRGLIADGTSRRGTRAGCRRTLKALAERSLRRPHTPAHSRRHRRLDVGRARRKNLGYRNRR